MELIRPRSRDIFKSQAEVLCCPVNCIGVMGNGLARAFRDRIDGLYEQYRQRCNCGYITTNGLDDSNLLSIGHGKYVLLFPTKQHFENPSDKEWIRMGLLTLPRLMESRGLTSVAIPALGCGKGELDWDHDVRPMILNILQGSRLKVELYDPH